MTGTANGPDLTRQLRTCFPVRKIVARHLLNILTRDGHLHSTNTVESSAEFFLWYPTPGQNYLSPAPEGSGGGRHQHGYFYNVLNGIANGPDLTRQLRICFPVRTICTRYLLNILTRGGHLHVTDTVEARLHISVGILPTDQTTCHRL